MRRILFVACALIFLIPSGSALAQMSFTELLFMNSPESLATFDLLFNSYDYMTMSPADFAFVTGDESTRYLSRPSMTSDGNPRVLYTNLSNIGDVNTFQAGGFIKAGPGNLGGALAWYSADNEYRDGDYRSGWEDEAAQLHLTYGWKLSPDSSLGFAYDYFDYSSPDYYYDVTDDWDETDHQLVVAYRRNLGEKSTFTVQGIYGMGNSEWVDREEDDGDTYVWYREDIDYDWYGVGGRMTWYAGNNDYAVFASIGMGSASFANDVIRERPTVRVTDDDIDQTSYTLGGQFLHRFDKTDFTGALIFEQEDEEYSVDVEGDPWQHEDYDRFTWQIPLGVRHHFSDRFSVFAGARFVHYDWESEWDEESYRSEGSQSVTDYRLGARYQATDGLAVQILFADEDYDGYPDRDNENGDYVRRGEQIDTSIVSLMVSFSF